MKDKGKVYIYNICGGQKEKEVEDLEGFSVRMVLLLLIPEKRERRCISYRSISHSWWDEKGGNWAYARKPYPLRLLLQRMT